MERLRSEASARGFRSLGAAPPSMLVIEAPRETSHIMLRKSHGFSCSFSSNSREMGRIACSATACVICRIVLMVSDSSKSIMVVAPLHDGEAVEGREAARVAQPELDHVVADVAVPAEHLQGVVGD